MTNASGVNAWTLRMPAGSLQQWLFTMTTAAPPGNVPYPISGATGWEYIVRTSATDTTPGGVVSITTTVGTPGVLTVTGTALQSSVLLDMYPAATATLAPGTYFHALWESPGTPAQAYAWFTGSLIIEGNPQP